MVFTKNATRTSKSGTYLGTIVDAKKETGQLFYSRTKDRIFYDEQTRDKKRTDDR
jgi:hypothetical protein